MPRIHNIKPDYPHSYRLTEVNRDARYLNLLLRTLADDRGRVELARIDLARRLFPGDTDAPSLVQSWLYALQDIEAIELYQVDKVDYLRILHWDDEQTICHPTPSVLPPSPTEPPDDSRISRNSRTRRRQLPKTQGDQAVGDGSGAVLENEVSMGEGIPPAVTPDGVVRTFERIRRSAEAEGSVAAAVRAAEMTAKYAGIRPPDPAGAASSSPRSRSPAGILSSTGEGLLAPHEYHGLPATNDEYCKG